MMYKSVQLCNMTQVSISKFRQNLPTYINRVFAGEEFEIMKNKLSVAVIVPASRIVKKAKAKKIPAEVFGTWKGRWPKTMSSIDIVNKWREDAWRGRNDS